MDKSKLRKFLNNPEQSSYEDSVAFNDKIKGLITELKNKKVQEADVIYNIRGKKGEKGDKGDTPKKGTDYWTKEDIKELEDSLRGTLTPEKGKDYFTAEEIQEFAKHILVRAVPKKGIDYKDGINGRDGISGTDGIDGRPGERGPRGLPGAKGEKGDKGPKGDSTSPQDVMEEIKKSKTFQIEKKHIKGFDMSDQRWHGGGVSKSYFNSNVRGSSASPTSRYVILNGGSTTTTVEADTQTPCHPGTFVSFKVRAVTNTTAGSIVFSLRVNGVTQGLSVTVPAATTGTFTSTSPVAVADNDLVNIFIDSSSSASGTITFTFQLEFTS